MANCHQTPTQSVLQHGESVWRFTQRILAKDFDGMRIPDWFVENFDHITSNLHPLAVVEEYNVLHDCGKPYCLVVDEDGKRHFPNHAQVSKETYLSLEDSSPTVGDLIGLDMVLHTATSEELDAMCLPKSDAFTLLVTAFAEIHSNAAMFGGIESTSFKSKWKKLDRRGKQLLKGGVQ